MNRAGANPAASGPAPGFLFRRLAKPEEYRAAEELQRRALGLGEEAPAAAGVQKAAQDNGGLVLGAFSDIHLAGVAIGFLGWDGSELYHYCHALVVRPEYQNHRVGFRLGAFLREEVLRQGLPRLRSVIDPLSSRAAELSIRRLGAEPDRYLFHYFGQSGSETTHGSETDRLRLLWNLTGPRMEGRLAGGWPTEEELRRRHGSAAGVVETEVGPEGLRQPVAVEEPEAEEAHLEIPFDLRAIEEHAPGTVRRWRHAVRDAFRAALDRGYRIDDFAVLSTDGERRSFYFLKRGPAAADPGPAAR